MTNNRTTSRRDALRLLTGTSASLLLGQTLFGCRTSALTAIDASIPSNDGGGLNPDSGASALDSGIVIDGGTATCEPTNPDALGPFFESGAPMRSMIAMPDEPGDRLLISGRVLSATQCDLPRAGYTLDLWQATAAGDYPDAASTSYRLRGRVVTATDGTFEFETIKPGFYSNRPAHIHFRIYRAGESTAALTSQLYFTGDPYLGAADSCQPPTCHSNDPARIISLVPMTVSGTSGFHGSFPIYV